MCLGSVFFLCSCRFEPRLEIRIDGKPKVGSSSKTLTLFNRGSADLIVEDYVVSCECTEIDLIRKQKILSGDSLSIKYKINDSLSASGSLVCLTIKANTKPQLTSVFLP